MQEEQLTEEQIKLFSDYMRRLAKRDAEKDTNHFRAKGIKVSLRALMKRGLRCANQRWCEIDTELKKKQAAGMSFQQAVDSFLAEVSTAP
jgi:hypothetical protein